MKRFLQIGNILALVFALVANALVGAQILDVPSVKSASDAYATLLTPASYAFSIWSLIYTLLVVFTVYQARDLFRPDDENDLPHQIGPYFMIANICNGLWTYIFVKDYIGLSVFILLALTGSLYVLLKRLRIATFDGSRSTIGFVWWPLSFYTGWVTIATVVNIASWLESIGVTISTAVACIVLALVTIGLLVLLYTRNTRELLLASAWGIFAIGVQQSQPGGNDVVSYAAYGAVGILLLQAGYHGFKNRHTNPFFKKAT